MEELDGVDLITKWQDQNKIWHFENSTRNLAKVVNVIGYREDMFGSAVENFLNDNPGAQIAIVEWIGQWIDRNKDWKEAFVAELAGEEPEEDEEG
jgi:hypothetical protein